MVLKQPQNTNPSGSQSGSARGGLALSLVLVLLLAGFFLFDLGRFLTFEFLVASRERGVELIAAQPLLAGLTFFLTYVLVAAMSVPGGAVLTLAAGALFGVPTGLLLVSFASTIGATLAMLAARRVLGSWVQTRFAVQLASVNAGLARNGGYFLFGLRMVPLFPFFVVNLVMGLTSIRTPTFYWVSQIGMLPGTLLYVFAGSELGKLDSARDILSPGIIVALALLGIFPFLARELVARLGSRFRSRSEGL